MNPHIFTQLNSSKMKINIKRDKSQTEHTFDIDCVNETQTVFELKLLIKSYFKVKTIKRLILFHNFCILLNDFELQIFESFKKCKEVTLTLFVVKDNFKLHPLVNEITAFLDKSGIDLEMNPLRLMNLEQSLHWIIKRNEFRKMFMTGSVDQCLDYFFHYQENWKALSKIPNIFELKDLVYNFSKSDKK